MNEEGIDLLQQKELSNETVTKQGRFLVGKRDEFHFEELICETIVQIVENCNFQTDNSFINACIISDDEVLVKCHREIALLEYLLGNSKYHSVIVEGEVHYSEQG